LPKLQEELIMMLPRVVYQMCVHGALLAGSAAKKATGEEIEPNDYDLLVPHEKWQVIALLIPTDAIPNKFGGWRFMTDFENQKVEVDIWPSTLLQYLSECKSKYGEEVVVVDFIRNKKYSSKFVNI